ARDPAGGGDHGAHRNRPAVLDERDGCRHSLGNGVAEVPDRVIVEHMAVLELCGARDSASLGSFLAAFSEAHERADDRAEPLRLLLVEIALLDRLDLAVGVLPHQQQIDQPNDVALLQPRELCPDLAREVVVVEADDEHLNRAEGQSFVCMRGNAHRPCSTFCFCTSNSASVRTPWLWSSPSFWSCSIELSDIP